MADNWNSATTEIPTSIPLFSIRLYYDETGIGLEQGVRYHLEIANQNGEIMDIKNGSLLPFMTAGQIAAAQTFFDEMKAKAEAELLQ